MRSTDCSRFAKLPPSRAFAPYVSFSRTLRAFFVRLQIFLGWICSPAETFHFPKTIIIIIIIIIIVIIIFIYSWYNVVK